ncbi:Isochorismatase-like protein [Phlyctochytrium arcticum]|nr:Isochorismatase-like protein [Phlyctochytrium arcticum]
MVSTSKTLLLLCDFQVGILEYWKNDDDWKRQVAQNIETLVKRVRKSLPYQTQELLIGFVGVAYSAGYPEIGPNSPPIIQHFRKQHHFLEGSADIEFQPAPVLGKGEQSSEFIVYKTRGSAFHDTRLLSILHAQGISRIAIAGLATNGVVLSTVRQAFDHDLDVVVLQDCCGDLEKGAHDAVMKFVMPAQARVMGWEDWMASLETGEDVSSITVEDSEA